MSDEIQGICEPIARPAVSERRMIFNPGTERSPVQAIEIVDKDAAVWITYRGRRELDAPFVDFQCLVNHSLKRGIQIERNLRAF